MLILIIQYIMHKKWLEEPTRVSAAQKRNQKSFQRAKSTDMKKPVSFVLLVPVHSGIHNLHASVYRVPELFSAAT